jgi:protein PhnA
MFLITTRNIGGDARIERTIDAFDQVKMPDQLNLQYLEGYDASLSSSSNRTDQPLMSTLPNCPACKSELTYEDGSMYICPECAHEWSKDAASTETTETKEVRDAVGNILKDGDSVTVIKDLKVKGSSSVVKVGTKVKNIRLVNGDHDIDCKIDGIGSMGLKSEFVKKV